MVRLLHVNKKIRRHAVATSLGDQQPEVVIRPLREADLPVADCITRVAFGTFIGDTEPSTFMGDVDYVRSRWETDQGAAFAAKIDGELVGSNFATKWGSFGFFGPLVPRPDFRERTIRDTSGATRYSCRRSA